MERKTLAKEFKLVINTFKILNATGLMGFNEEMTEEGRREQRKVEG